MVEEKSAKSDGSLADLAEGERGGMLRFAFGMLHDWHEAEDCVQEAFARMQEAWDRAREPRIYLYKTLHNLCLERYRSKRRPQGVDRPVSVCRSESSENEALAEEQRLAVRRALESLPEHERAAVLLREAERFSYRQIAETLGASVPQVNNWISRGKHELRRRLKPYIEKGRMP